MTIKVSGIPGAENITVEGMAEEETLRKLLVIQKKMYAANAIKYDNLRVDIDDTSDSFQDLDEATEDYIETQEHMTTTANALIKSWDNTKEVLKNLQIATSGFVNSISAGSDGFSAAYGGFIDPIANITSALIEGLGAATGGLIAMTGTLVGVGGAATVVGKGLSAMSSAVAKVVNALIKFGLGLTLEQIDAAWDMFQGVTNAGGLFGDGLTTMVEQMDMMNLTSSEYTKVIQENAAELSRFGGTVAQGSLKLARITAAQSDYVLGLKDIGISNQEQAERNIEYMDMMQRAGKLHNMSINEIAIGSRNYMRSLQIISAITGKQADEIKKERNERMLNMAFQTKMRKLEITDKARFAEINLMMDVMPAHLQKQMMKTVLFGNAMNDLGGQMFGMNKFLQQYSTSVINGTATNEQAFMTFSAQIKASGDDLLALSDKYEAVYMAQALGVGNDIATELAEYGAGQITFIDKMKNLTEGSREEIYNSMIRKGKEDKGASDGLVKANQQLREMNQKLMKGVILQINPITDAMIKINKYSLQAVNALANFGEGKPLMKMDEMTAILTDNGVDTKKLTIATKSLGQKMIDLPERMGTALVTAMEASRDGINRFIDNPIDTTVERASEVLDDTSSYIGNHIVDFAKDSATFANSVTDWWKDGDKEKTKESEITTPTGSTMTPESGAIEKNKKAIEQEDMAAAINSAFEKSPVLGVSAITPVGTAINKDKDQVALASLNSVVDAHKKTILAAEARANKSDGSRVNQKEKVTTDENNVRSSVAELTAAWNKLSDEQKQDKQMQQAYQENMQRILLRIATAVESQDKTTKNVYRESQ